MNMISIMKHESTMLPVDRIDPTDRQTYDLQRDEVLFLQDEHTRGLFRVLEGSIDLTRCTRDGHQFRVHRARSGETFAEASLFAKHYHCTATANRASRVVEFKRAAIERLLATDASFTQSLLSCFAQQIQQERRRAELLCVRSADERVLAAIADGVVLDDIASFADSIALAPETVYRSLASLTRHGRLNKVARGQYQLR